MGKKRVIKKTEKELLSETEKIEKKLKKEVILKSGPASLGGKVYVSSSYNNTIISLTDASGNVLYWASAGSIGFKGTKKGTSFAASKVAEAIVEACKKYRVKEVLVYIKGIGGGRDSSLKTFAAKGLDIIGIKDITPIPHNGCKPRKPRRV